MRGLQGLCRPRTFSASLCCLQVWGNLPECVCQAAHHAQQVFPAHRNGLPGFLSALEAAEQVSRLSCGGRCGGQPSSAGGPRGGWSLSVSDSLKVLTPVCLCRSPQQEVQNIFKAKHPMDTEITKAKVTASLMAFPSRGPAGGSCGAAVFSRAATACFLTPLLPHRLLGSVLHSLKKLIPILQISWEPESSTPKPARLGAYCVWSRTCKPRSGLLRKQLNALTWFLSWSAL